MFEGVDCDDLTVVSADYHNGDVICEQGDVGNSIWIVIRGSVTVEGANGRVVATRQPGELIGEQALIETDGRRTARLLAASGLVTLVEIGAAQLLVHRDQLTWNLSRILSGKLKNATVERDDLLRRSKTLTDLLRQYVGTYALSQESLRPAGRDRPDHEELRAVMWFSDIVGFSQLTRDKAPSFAARLVDQLLEPQFRAIESNRGFIDKFMGDGVMAFWLVDGDTAASHCEAALRAARDALASVGTVKIDCRPCELRIGLHIGHVFAGVFGTNTRRSFTLIGDEVNLASRYEQVRVDSYRRELGPIRVSTAFQSNLSDQSRLLVPHRFRTAAKGTPIEGYSDALTAASSAQTSDSTGEDAAVEAKVARAVTKLADHEHESS